jgi:hypothetical protein
VELSKKKSLVVLDNDPVIWEQNKGKMIQILKNAPVVGIYKN